MTELHRGDIFYIERFDTTGSEQHSGRPGIIVSNEKNNQFSATVEVVYLTSKPKEHLPTHVIIDSTGIKSIALCEQITSVDKSKIGAYKCTATPDEMHKVDLAMMESLELRYSLTNTGTANDIHQIQTQLDSLKEALDKMRSDYAQEQTTKEIETQTQLQNLRKELDKIRSDYAREQMAKEIYKQFYEDYIDLQREKNSKDY